MTEDTRGPAPEKSRVVDPRPVVFADPAPLGLAGFALTTLLLSIVNTNLLKEAGAIFVVLGVAAFYGGLAQFVAGLFEFRRGNTFGATAFGSYGAFWLTYWWIVPRLALGGDVHNAVGLYLLGWGIFTAFMAVAALRTTLPVLGVFVLLTPTYIFLAIGEFQGGRPPHVLTEIGGWFGIATGLVAWYAAAAAVINETHGRAVLPTWPHLVPGEERRGHPTAEDPTAEHG